MSAFQYDIASLKSAYLRFTQELPSASYWPPAFRDEVAQLVLKLGGAVTSMALFNSRHGGEAIGRKMSQAVERLSQMLVLERVVTRQGVLDAMSEVIRVWPMMDVYDETTIGEKIILAALRGSDKQEWSTLRNQVESLSLSLAELRTPKVYTVPVPNNPPVLVNRPVNVKPIVGIGVALGVLLILRRS